MQLGVMDMSVNRGDLAAVVAAAEGAAGLGAASFWIPNLFGLDALTCLAVAGGLVPDIALGTAVVPVFGRRPLALAQQALSVQAATAGRLSLGVGLSHRVFVDAAFGPWLASPVSYLDTYLEELSIRCAEPTTQSTAVDTLRIRATRPLPILVAALGPRTLEVAGRRSDGVVLWNVGPRTVASLTVPSVRAAAAAAGRPEPRIVVCVGACVTDDASSARAAITRSMGAYDDLPSYRATFAREGVASIGEVALVGDEAAVAAAVDDYRRAGATELVVANFGLSDRSRAATEELLGALMGPRG